MVRAWTGSGGQVRWGYRPVATLLRWTFTRTDEGGTLTAQIADGDEFGLQQQPLVVVVPAGPSQVRWPVRDLARDGLAVTVTVGPMES